MYFTSYQSSLVRDDQKKSELITIQVIIPWANKFYNVDSVQKGQNISVQVCVDQNIDFENWMS